MKQEEKKSKRSLEEGLKDHFKERLNEALLGKNVSRSTLGRMGRVRGGKMPGGRVKGELYGASGTDPYGNARRREGRGLKGSGRGMASMLSAEFGIPRIV